MIDHLAVPSTSNLPAAIGRYRIAARLGKGAMGVVYSARDDQMGRDVAIKVMMTDLEGEAETRARFFREAQITSRLLHRNIITVFDTGEDDGRLFIVMELLKGQTLTEFLKVPEHQTLEQKIDLMIQTCEGLAVAHAKGVVHRDIKPGNLFVQSDGGLKILDFGVARLASSNMTASGLIVGTPDYMSPEQARGKEVDARSDIFSAAAVFYFMVTGRKPFEGPDLPVVLQKVVREDPPPIREHEAPPPLARVIAKAISKEPDRRYQRVADMTADLVRFKRHFDTETRQLGTSAKEQFDEIVRAAATVRELRAALGIAPALEVDDVERGIRVRYPFFCPPDGAAPVVAPFRRGRLSAIVTDLQAVFEPLQSEADHLRAALSGVEQAERALEQRDGRSARRHFTLAAQALPAPSTRVANGESRARELTTDQQALEDRVQALTADARAAEKSSNWTAVIELCSQVLSLQSHAPDIAALAARARTILSAEADARGRRVQQIVTQAGKAIQTARFDEAERLLHDARSLGPDSGTVSAAESRLNDARAASAAHNVKTRRAAQEIAAARAAFDSGRRDVAIEQLDAFARENPDAPGITAELRHLKAEAARLAGIEERRVQVAGHAQAAEGHWERGEIVAALKSADLALSIDRSEATALRIQGLAQTRLREQAAAAARSAEATRHTNQAVEWLAAGRFDKAAREAERALMLEPGRADASGVQAEARRLEKEAEAVEHRRAAARARDREVEKMLKGVRRSLRGADYQGAARSAENALLINPEHAQTQQLLAQAQAALAAAPVAQDAEDTVRLTPDRVPAFDPDATAVIHRRAAVKDVVTNVGDWASGLRRKLGASRGQTTTEWLMIAGVFSAIGVFALRIVPTALKAFLWGLTSGIKSIAP